MKTEIRVMAAGDWEAVRDIYLAGIATGQATFETEAPSWTAWNNGHLPAPRIVAVVNKSANNGSVAGWAALSAVSSRSAYAGVAEVSVYVAEQMRGAGIGRLLLESLVKQSEQNGIWTLQASIFPENAASVSLHNSCGFREVGRRLRIAKMKGVWRDTLLLERRSELIGVD
jgi:L-amino acid N-acyltransferase YncA